MRYPVAKEIPTMRRPRSAANDEDARVAVTEPMHRTSSLRYAGPREGRASRSPGRSRPCPRARVRGDARADRRRPRPAESMARRALRASRRAAREDWRRRLPRAWSPTARERARASPSTSLSPRGSRRRRRSRPGGSRGSSVVEPGRRCARRPRSRAAPRRDARAGRQRPAPRAPAPRGGRPRNASAAARASGEVPARRDDDGGGAVRQRQPLPAGSPITAVAPACTTASFSRAIASRVSPRSPCGRARRS